MRIEDLLTRERSLRVREAHMKREAQRCRREAEELRKAAWTIQHRRGAEQLEHELADYD